MQPTDQILLTAVDRLSATYGTGSEAFDWQEILASLLNVASQCNNPTPASARANMKLPGVQMIIRRRLAQSGVPILAVSKVVQSVFTTLEKATDSEIAVLFQAELATR